MAVPFNYPENISTVLKLVRHVDHLTEQALFGSILLVLLGMIAFLATKAYSSEKAMMYASFLVLISSILLRFLNLITDGILYLCVIIFVGSFVWLIVARGKETV